jgi:hypothetical protein
MIYIERNEDGSFAIQGREYTVSCNDCQAQAACPYFKTILMTASLFFMFSSDTEQVQEQLIGGLSDPDAPTKEEHIRIIDRVVELVDSWYKEAAAIAAWDKEEEEELQIFEDYLDSLE